MTKKGIYLSLNNTLSRIKIGTLFGVDSGLVIYRESTGVKVALLRFASDGQARMSEALASQ
jgi:hypothetical protein